MIRLLLVAISVWTVVTTAFGQPVIPSDPLSQGVSTLLESRTTVQVMSPTRHAAVPRIRGLGSWHSSGLNYVLPHSTHGPLPLHLLAPDLIPLELLDADSIELVRGPNLLYSFRSPAGALIVHHKNIPDSLIVESQLFAGSETGDPVIQRFTRSQLPLRNRQKVGESGSFSVAGGQGPWKARLQGVSLAHFSSGYEQTDPLLSSYAPDLSTDHNAARYLGLEVERSIPGHGAITGGAQYHRAGGWDMFGFFPTFVHYSHSDASFAAMYSNDDPELTVNAAYASSRFELSPLSGSPGAAFTSHRGAYNAELTFLRSDVLSIPMSIQVSQTTISQQAVPPDRQALFSGPFSGWAAALQSGAEASIDGFHARVSGRLDRHLNNDRSVSLEASLRVPLDHHKGLTLAAHSVARPPTVEELHGRYLLTRTLPGHANADTFDVHGSANLRTENIQSIEMTLEASFNRVKASTRVFVQAQRSPIQFVTTRIVQTPLHADIVWEGSFSNVNDRSAIGLDIDAAFGSDVGVSGQFSYAYFDNEKIPDYPRHTLLITGSAEATTGLTFDITARGTSRTRWPHFRIKADDNYADGTSIIGEIPEYWLVNVAVTQRLQDVVFLGVVDLRIEILNVLNRRYKLLPFGAELSAAGFGYVYVSF